MIVIAVDRILLRSLCLLKTPYDVQSLIISPSESSSRSRMLDLILALLAAARSSFKPQRELALENLALRQQLAILKRNTNRPRLTWIDRAFWATRCRVFAEWRQSLIIAKPETVIG